MREYHVQFCEGLVGKFHWSTHHFQALFFIKDLDFYENGAKRSFCGNK